MRRAPARRIASGAAYDDLMGLSRSRPSESRERLIERKHALEGEITTLAAEVRRLRRRGEPVDRLEVRLTRLRNDHFQTRLAIDRARSQG